MGPLPSRSQIRTNPGLVESGTTTPLLTLRASQTVTHGDRRFAVAAATLWNGLPDSFRTAKTQPQYKTLLKTPFLISVSVT